MGGGQKPSPRTVARVDVTTVRAVSAYERSGSSAGMGDHTNGPGTSSVATRRALLRWTGAATGTVVLAACDATPEAVAPTADASRGDVTADSMDVPGIGTSDGGSSALDVVGDQGVDVLTDQGVDAPSDVAADAPIDASKARWRA